MDAIVFDFDGTLVDTEPIHESAIRSVLRRYDVPVRKGMTIGLADEDAVALAFSEAGHRAPGDLVTALCAQKVELYAELVRDLEIFIYEGAVDLVHAAADRGPVGICTAAVRSEVVAVIDRLGVADRVRAIVTADMVERKKPAPDGYLAVAERLGVRPERCLAIEDSPRGVASAKRAGYAVVAVMQTTPAEDLSEADLIVEKIADVDLEAAARLISL